MKNLKFYYFDKQIGHAVVTFSVVLLDMCQKGCLKMSKKKYEFEDFLEEFELLEWGRGEDKQFIAEFHEALLQRDCKVKITSSKQNPFLLAYTQKRKGVMSLYLRKKGLKARINVNHMQAYPDVLNALPEAMIDQIDKSHVCKNMVGQKCWEGCTGYDFHIKDTHYQKCRYECFQFDVVTESMPFLLGLLETELEERLNIS